MHKLGPSHILEYIYYIFVYECDWWWCKAHLKKGSKLIYFFIYVCIYIFSLFKVVFSLALKLFFAVHNGVDVRFESALNLCSNFVLVSILVNIRTIFYSKLQNRLIWLVNRNMLQFKSWSNMGSLFVCVSIPFVPGSTLFSNLALLLLQVFNFLQSRNKT